MFTARIAALKVGGNFDRAVDQGPVNSKMQYDKILGYIARGRQEGAAVHLGGGPDADASRGSGGKGYYVEPTIFTNVMPDMAITREENFGPVVTVAKFKTEAEVVALANDTTYGLAGAVHTKDYARARLGRECGKAVLENYTEVKAVYLNTGVAALQ
ncbi:hypothetical protein SCUCBS95973_001013 [Sporothrix curviconia]|uniref:aldehyde dehydrogenase (NAD(+)) n=1 Tax=Sporothrix curviconia TaxID=1260050 RepID=A0ABP0AUZ2_9PEZI